MLTKKEKSLRNYLIFSTFFYLLVFIYCFIGLFAKAGVNTVAGTPLLTGITLLAFINILLSWYATADLRKSLILIKLNVWESIFITLTGICILLWSKNNGIITVLYFVLPFKSIIALISIGGAANTFLLSEILASAEKERYGLKYFSPLQFHTLKALAEVIISGEKEIISSEEIARNVDSYFNSFEAKSKWTMSLVITGLYFYPLLSCRPPLPYMSSEIRLKFLKKRFYAEVEKRLIPEFWRIIAQGMIRIAKQMCYIGYYNDKRTFPSVGYVPFSERKDREERISKSPVKESPPLYVKTVNDFNGQRVDGDVVIIGSGAAASILARGLVESGRKVVMVERGNYERPETFNENEMEMVSRLFQDGAIQAARDFRFTVFQGSCVGGSTVVNNAVCFRMPEDVLDRWNDPTGINAGLDKKKVFESEDRVWKMIGTNHMEESRIKLNPGGKLFEEGCRKLGYDLAPNITQSVNANISACYGCGYCNIGCQYNKKLSMLVTILPGIQNEFGRESLDIIAGCEAVKLHKNGQKISCVEGEFNNGKKIKIYGKTFVVSAGAISSSILLLKSKLDIKNAGLNLSFNIGSQMTAAFPHKVNSYDGLQISHYLKILPDTGYIMETWFNPPMFQSTAMPGWFEDHFNNMKRYDRLACVGILVGSDSNARAKVAGLTRREIDYTPTKKDFETLLKGLEVSGEIMLAAGAESVMPNSFKYYEFKSREEVNKLHEKIRDPSEIALGTGHPQGGNILTGSSNTGVVNPEFKVYGYDNLYVSDASIFPTSLGVNPQLTVMALADYSSAFIKENKG